jgi:hypothetical protein
LNQNIIYDDRFNSNEWLVISLIVIGFGAILLFPKPFTKTQALFNLLIGIVFGLMFDHTIALPPFDYYDVGDQAQYQLFDIFSYTMYGPFGYFFVYFYYKFRIRSYFTMLYIGIWTLSGIALEWVGLLTGIFHYKNGYQLYYSVPIYLFLQSLHLLLYHFIFKKEDDAESTKKEELIQQQAPLFKTIMKLL